MALFLIKNGVEDTPNQANLIEIDTAMIRFLGGAITQFVSVDIGNNRMQIATDSFYMLPAGKRTFALLDGDAYVGQASIDIGGNFKADTRYYLYLVADASNADGAFSISESATAPLGVEPADALFVALFRTAELGRIDPNSVYDSQMMQRDNQRYPLSTLYHALPMQPKPHDAMPMFDWFDVTPMQGSGWFRVGSALGVQQESLPNIEGNIGHNQTGSDIGKPFDQMGTTGAFAVSGIGTNQKIAPATSAASYYGKALFSAQLSHPAYQDNAPVQPEHQQYLLFERYQVGIGTITVYTLNGDGTLRDSIEVPKRLDGTPVGFNVNTCTLVAPPPASRALRAGDAKAWIFDQAKTEWMQVADNRGKVAHSASGSRTIFALGDGLLEGESWDAPLPTEQGGE